MIAPKLPDLFALITREPKLDLKHTKTNVLRLKVKFGHLSVALSNAGGARKCVGDYYTFSQQPQFVLLFIFYCLA